MTATWVFNILLLLLPRPLAQAFLASGASWYACVEWDANNQAHPSTACTEPPPFFALPRVERDAVSAK